MRILGLVRIGVVVLSLGVMGGCSGQAQSWGGACEQDGDCVDSTCQSDASGQRVCIKSCSAAGTWACNKEASAVYRCDGTKFLQFAACTPCVVGPASSSYGYAEGLTGVYYCDAQTRSRTSFPALKIPFAQVGEPCSNTNTRDTCFIDDAGNRTCAKTGLACTVDKQSILSCTSGRWQSMFACVDGRVCDSYGYAVGAGTQSVFPTFSCIY